MKIIEREERILMNMETLKNKIDFAIIFTVKNANPNGDPTNGNRPRETFEGLGEISDVCLKRKIRNRLQDFGERIYVQTEDRCDDGCASLAERVAELAAKYKNNRMEFEQAACEKWIDVRAFGGTFAISGAKKGDGLSFGVRGPVTIQSAYSLEPIIVETIQITKSVNGKTEKGKGSDTFGEKHSVPHAVYVAYGSINCQSAERTGFTNDDAEKIKKALMSLFENDESSARPAGSMEVNKLYWWTHNSKSGQYSSAKVHRMIKLKTIVDNPINFEDYEVINATPDDLRLDIYDGQ